VESVEHRRCAAWQRSPGKSPRIPLTSWVDRGLISAPWHPCPVVGQPMTNLNSPMPPVGQSRPAAPAQPSMAGPPTLAGSGARRCWSDDSLAEFVHFRPDSPCSSMEALVKGGPCEITARSTDATSTPPPGAVEPTAVVDPVASNGIPDGRGSGPARSRGSRGSLHLRSASLAVGSGRSGHEFDGLEGPRLSGKAHSQASPPTRRRR